MRHVIRYSVLVLLFFALITASLALLGRQQPAPTLVQMLHLTDCALPCWIGIIPGKTTLADARTRIIDVFGHSGDLVTFDLISAPGLVWINVERPKDPVGVLLITMTAHDNRMVDAITFDFSSIYLRDRLHLADVVNVLGVPSRVMLPIYPNKSGKSMGEFSVLYGNNQSGLIATALLNNPIDWEEEIQLLVLYGRGQMPIDPFSESHRWHGFGSLEQYYGGPR